MTQIMDPPDTHNANGHHAAQDLQAIALAIYDDILTEEPTYTLDPAVTGDYAKMLSQLKTARKNSLEAAERVAKSIKARTDSPLAQLLTQREELANRDNVGTLLSDVIPEEVRWLWPGRLALQKLHMLDGDPGLGKTIMVLDLIARLTTGRLMPGEENWAAQPAGAVIISLEDGLSDTLQPRLSRAGADLSKVLSMAYLEDDRMFSLETDLPLLEAGIKRVGAKLVLLDPIMALLGGKDTYKDNEVRATLTPLKALAERCNVAIILIRHVNKGGSEKLIYQGGGSIGFIGLSRIGLMVLKNPEDEEQCILANIKNNLTKTAPKLLYRVVDDKPDDERPYVKWEGITTISNSDLVRAPSKNTGGHRNAILAFLKEHKPVAMEVHEIQEAIPDMTPSNLKMTLKRMYEHREIEKSARGAYYAKD